VVDHAVIEETVIPAEESVPEADAPQSDTAAPRPDAEPVAEAETRTEKPDSEAGETDGSASLTGAPETAPDA